MIRHASFQRKVIYLAAMIPILAALAYLGLPATGSPEAENYRAGGKLARLRATNELSQATLGEIDPAGETMKLATLGMRPVATTILWHKANEYKLRESWDALAATLNQITKLQPNFISVWEFQAHNISYNVSVEFDDYRQRYQWVKKGIEFLLVGTVYNKQSYKLPWNLGWFVGQKIGRADEKKEFRALFKLDADFHEELGKHVAMESSDALGADNLHPDNWKVSRLFYLQSLQRLDARNEHVSNLELWRQTRGQLGGRTASETARGRSALLSQVDPHMALVNYATTIQGEGRVGEVAQVAWRQAGKSWLEFGRFPIKTSWGDAIQLGMAEEVQAEIDRLNTELDSLAPGQREALFNQRMAELSPEERSAYDLKVHELTQANSNAYHSGHAKTRVTPAEVAERAPNDVRPKALRLAARISEQEVIVTRIKQYREIVNFEYWRVRCEAEASDDAINARKYLFEAEQLGKQAETLRAKEAYDAAWDNWAKVIEKYPLLLTGVTINELQDPLRRYRDTLKQLGEPFPENFKLQQVVEMLDQREQNRAAPAPPPGASLPPPSK